MDRSLLFLVMSTESRSTGTLNIMLSKLLTPDRPLVFLSFGVHGNGKASEFVATAALHTPVPKSRYHWALSSLMVTVETDSIRHFDIYAIRYWATTL